MSLMKIELGQKVLLPIENQDFDNNAELDNSSNTSSGEEQQNIEVKTNRKYLKIYQILIIKMFNFFKEFCFMILVAFVYTALTNDPPKVSKSPAAYPFFAKHSIVTDWYRGQISLAIEQARKSDIAFVMFYAPWDAKSQDIRHEFELSAKYMQYLISFTAINCWQPESECHQQYRKVYNWPVLIAYPTHGRGIQYNGIKTAGHMIKFLTAIISPLIRISDVKEIPPLLAVYDAVIVAEVDASPGSFDYAVFYSIALRFLERDPYREVAFTVITTSNWKQPLLRIYMWNETLVYPNDMEWKTESLLSWIYKYLHQITMWISPSGTKSQQLASYIQSNPALILFTPRNPLLPFVDYYDLLKTTALNYFNCDNQTWIQKIHDILNNKRQENMLNYKHLQNKCIKKEKPVRKYSTIVSISKMWPNNSCIKSNEKGCVHGTISNLEESLEICKRLKNNHVMCNDFVVHNPQSNCITNDNVFDTNMKTSMLSGRNDPKSMENLKQIYERNECILFQLANKITEPITFEKSSPSFDDQSINVTGLSCASNLTLSFIAMDTLKYHHFAERLGVDLENDNSAVIIVNEKMESHYVLKDITSNKLNEFIYNFTVNQLQRAFYASSVEFKETHVYPELKNCNLKENREEFCVNELNSRNFLPTVMQINKAVIVFYHSKQCSFCNGISYKFLNVAKIFAPIEDVIFARIDGELNNLPWEYTMDVYPTILYFPPYKKSESRVFPTNIQVTIPNLINFILINVEPSMKLHAMWILCKNIKFTMDKNACIASIRVEILSLINKHLKLWRNGDSRERAELLYKLKQLRNLHLYFALSSPNNLDSSILNYLKKLSKTPISDIITSSKFQIIQDEL